MANPGSSGKTVKTEMISLYSIGRERESVCMFCCVVKFCIRFGLSDI